MDVTWRLFVKGRSGHFADDVLRDEFAAYGEILGTTNFPGCTLIEYAEHESVIRALERHGTELNGQQMTVLDAEPAVHQYPAPPPISCEDIQQNASGIAGNIHQLPIGLGPTLGQNALQATGIIPPEKLMAFLGLLHQTNGIMITAHPKNFENVATIKLESSDGELINTDIKVAKCFGVIRGMIENQTLDEANCENEVVPLSVVDSAVLREVIKFCTYHKEQPLIADGFYHITRFDACFLKVNAKISRELMTAAEYLDIPRLISVLNKKNE